MESILMVVDYFLTYLGLRPSYRDRIYHLTDKEREQGRHSFENDLKIPPLPVPGLEHTLKRYLESVTPLAANEEELEATRRAVEDFRRSPEAERWQAKLTTKAGQTDNWLEDWWLHFAYLRDRRPLVPHSNMAGPAPELYIWPPTSGTRIERTSVALYYVIFFWQLIRKGHLRPMTMKGNVPVSMDQFQRLFNTCRLPGEYVDSIISKFKTAAEGEAGPTNMIFIYKNRIFSVDFVLQPGDEILTPPEIAQQLTYIEKTCQELPTVDHCVASLTAGERTSWYHNRKHLINLDPDNEENLKLIEEALCVITLDDAEPANEEEVLRDAFTGNVAIRWSDKSMNTVYYGNSLAAAMGDHTPIDGITPAMLTHYVDMSLADCKGRWTGSKHVRADFVRVPPTELNFKLDDHLKSQMKVALEEYHRAASNLDIRRVYPKYGRSFLQPHKIHPEAFIQIALQAAYMRMHPDRQLPASVYCTATSRKFRRGRTETCRSCQTEIVDFARLLIKAESDEDLTNEQLYSSLQTAVKKFSIIMKEAMSGEGIDRHLLGLYCASQEEGYQLEQLPALFLDPLFSRTGGGGNFMLSTACSGYFEYSLLGGVPPMRLDGYAVFYVVEPQRSMFNCISFKSCPETSSDKFVQHIETSLRSLSAILQHNRPS